ncbi:MAG: addiction module protein [Rhodoferax sp.]|jgi:hypothetical protein|nr:addiction module protein [Rhodoferax sp.]MCP5290274.1 addiction module protein [Burkholderiaceae bacterium]
MSIPLEALASEVLRLPTEQRRRLLDRVVASLDADAAQDAAWDAVAAEREALVQKDPASMVPLAEALDRIRAELK